ncbi:hypothetical protein H1D32_07385 [Anaerobacillus sp. CMMVII]|uniref:hypothetical protein n=1 Tax=Anaerobacillus sp. CMMVII TaxID=2755588 RepID=UPI0021B7B060|nr:hypothetical protein [Anaerobacillus sp. CMMVII]MCT8137583.1 hypothetical protein [Anaerobacillus sp. CMMVII]
MKKVIITVFSVIIGFIFIYSLVWFESYQNSLGFYDQATESFENGEFGLALKGGDHYDAELREYVYTGGYEQVLVAWANKWAIPKPSVYYKAEEKINEIIYDKLTADEGFALFQQYFRVSNRHLPEILIQTGKLYIENEQYGKAEAVFQLAIDAFGRNETIRVEAQTQLELLNQ